jgi:hypothetical protein
MLRSDASCADHELGWPHFALYFVGIREGQEKIPSMEKYGGSKKGKI